MTSGTASRRRKKDKPIRRIDEDSWQKGYAAGKVGCGWSWDCGYLLGEQWFLRVADVTRKLDTNREH